MDRVGPAATAGPQSLVMTSTTPPLEPEARPRALLEAGTPRVSPESQRRLGEPTTRISWDQPCGGGEMNSHYFCQHSGKLPFGIKLWDNHSTCLQDRSQTPTKICCCPFHTLKIPIQSVPKAPQEFFLFWSGRGHCAKSFYDKVRIFGAPVTASCLLSVPRM